MNRIDMTEYDTLVKFRKISVPVSVSGAVRFGKARAYANRVFPGYSKDDHAKAAAEIDTLIVQIRKDYREAAERAAMETWGRPLQFSDYRISGIYSDEFSTEHKDILRNFARLESRASSIFHFHAKLRGAAR